MSITLFPFQEEGLSKALGKQFFFFNWAAGTGKGVVGVVGPELLHGEKVVDLTIVFTIRANKINFTRKLNEETALTAKNLEGTKTKRTVGYNKGDYDALVMNYEKAHFDLEEISHIVRGKRVLFILDEVQKVLRPNNALKGLRKILKTCQPIVWGMSASTVEDDPLRYWRLFEFMKPNLLGTQKDYKDRYVLETKQINFGKGRRTFVDIWEINKLKEIPQRVEDYTHVVRKTDEGVRELFKVSEFIVDPVQLSDQDQKLYDIIEELIEEQMTNPSSEDFSRVELFNALCFICITPEAFNHSDNKLARFLRDEGYSFTSDSSAKFEYALDKIDSVKSQGDKIVVFTKWTNLGLFPFSRVLDKYKISHVQHYGTGMTERQAQKAQDDFKTNKNITVFLTSDAGAEAINLQEAPYVLHLDVPHSYDKLMQRSNRIDRLDTTFNQLFTYLPVIDNSVEKRIWRVNNYRRKLSENIYGTEEKLERPPLDNIDPNSNWLLLGR